MQIPGRHPLRSDDDSALPKSLPMRVPAVSNYRTQDIDVEDDRVTRLIIRVCVKMSFWYSNYVSILLRLLLIRKKWQPPSKQLLEAFMGAQILIGTCLARG